MEYINNKTGVTKGPLQISHKGPWIHHDTTTNQYRLNIFRTVNPNYNRGDTTPFLERSAKDKIIIQIPQMDTGWTDNKPNVGWNALTTTQWVKDYCDNYIDGETRIDVSTLATFDYVDGKVSDAIKFLQQDATNKVNILRNELKPRIDTAETEIDNLQETCNNINDWKNNALWILDGGSPSGMLRSI